MTCNDISDDKDLYATEPVRAQQRADEIQSCWNDAVDKGADATHLQSILKDARAAKMSKEWVFDPIGNALWYFKPLAAIGLIECGESLEFKDKDGRSALHDAAAKSMTAVVSAMIARGMILDARSTNGNTPLHDACQNACVDTARMLVAAGSDIEAKGERGYTPMHWACFSENPHICVAMMEMGSDPQALNDAGQTPVQMLIAEAGDPDAAARIAGVVDAYMNARRARQAIEEVMANASMTEMKLLP